MFLLTLSREIRLQVSSLLPAPPTQEGVKNTCSQKQPSPGAMETGTSTLPGTGHHVSCSRAPGKHDSTPKSPAPPSTQSQPGTKVTADAVTAAAAGN